MPGENDTTKGDGAHPGGNGFRARVETKIESIVETAIGIGENVKLLFQAERILGERTKGTEKDFEALKENQEKLATKESVDNLDEDIQELKRGQEKFATKENLKTVEDKVEGILTGDRRGALLAGGWRLTSQASDLSHGPQSPQRDNSFGRRGAGRDA